MDVGTKTKSDRGGKKEGTLESPKKMSLLPINPGTGAIRMVTSKIMDLPYLQTHVGG